jgi:DNA-binding NtrC family response regulator
MKVIVVDYGDENCLAEFLRIKDKNNGRVFEKISATSFSDSQEVFRKIESGDYETVVLRITPVLEETARFWEKMKEKIGQWRIIVVTDCPHFQEALLLKNGKEGAYNFFVFEEPIKDMNKFFETVAGEH